MSIAGLQQGAITLAHSNLVCGGGIQVGNKFTRCMGNHGTPDIKTAITRSCDGYFYRLGLEMGINGIVAMVDEFDINKRTGIDLPLSARGPRSWKRKPRACRAVRSATTVCPRSAVCSSLAATLTASPVIIPRSAPGSVEARTSPVLIPMRL